MLSIRDYSKVRVFPVSVYPIVYITTKNPPVDFHTARYERMAESSAGAIVCEEERGLDYERYFGSLSSTWPIQSLSEGVDIVSRICLECPRLDSIATVTGAATVAEAYEIQPFISESPDDSATGLMVVNSGTIDRYNLLWGKRKFRYLGDSYLRPVISPDRYSNLPPRRLQQAMKPKLIVAGMTRELECTIDLNGAVLAGKSTSIVMSDARLVYLLAILNSKLIAYYYGTKFGGDRLQGGYLRIGPPQLRSIPVGKIDTAVTSDVRSCDEIEMLAQHAINLYTRQADARTAHDKTTIQRQIDATDREIDRLVYELYGLTDDEIAIVEQRTPAPAAAR